MKLIMNQLQCPVTSSLSGSCYYVGDWRMWDSELHGRNIPKFKMLLLLEKNWFITEIPNVNFASLKDLLAALVTSDNFKALVNSQKKTVNTGDHYLLLIHYFCLLLYAGRRESMQVTLITCHFYISIIHW